ncbi:HPF/RaiA family ribosome-associated protein [Acinetobacter vivianii]|jgi:ribosomal subunit interface protein|uniref:HPF/RaiA family ribosome-associated protein n=1 Tax=Acinetobacter vivianii TaxID=1776742 RepID=N8WDB7_9GAMM|nr:MULTISPECIES: HPF/RaiA family ribosome-associated protein [Acinetobacter]ENU93287.1 ribosomal subunit interface protein [Acinetobacter vivianii]ENX19462.1 ribosomal subunit interface protein [Acinetobacter vivianii]KHF77165.1 putative ribosomal subunit interface protein [Acinetobacter sp. neg1]KYQ83509.1 ribosomal subunit interface protein [Acinetobacter sp. NRRL B-65365]MBJ8482858.1 HPF/RaiA family ribosome-associated protein [Acinetobacter vivianii]
MNIEIRTDKNIQGSERLISYVRAELTQEFQRYSERITHFSVHISDENGDKTGDHDKRCMIEARPAGMKPVAVTHKATNIDNSIHGAIDKLKRSLEHLYEKKDHHRGGLPEYVDADEDVKVDDEA